MTNHKVQLIGAPCGHHGNYTFYKAFKYTLAGRPKILAIGEFFFVKIWEDEDIISIGEIQLIWEDKASGQALVSLRLYFLPENTPEGRLDEHGEDEVVSLSEKIVLRADDVVGLIRSASEVKWTSGMLGVYCPHEAGGLESISSLKLQSSPLVQTVDVQEVLREKTMIGDVIESSNLYVIVLSYDVYCRLRALFKRLEGVADDVMKSKIFRALGGFLVPSKKTRLLFCRDFFDYPELEGHELLCNHMAPKLQGRPRKRRMRRPESESDETSENSVEDLKDLKLPKMKGLVSKGGLSVRASCSITSGGKQGPHSKGILGKPGLHPKQPSIFRPKSLNNSQKSNHLSSTSKSPSNQSILSMDGKNEFSTPALNRLIEVDFMSKLFKFMKDRNTAITRLPYLGYRQLNVFELFTRVQQLGGYEAVSQKKLWRMLYEEISGKSGNNTGGAPMNLNQFPHSGANVLRRHYERLLLPYENFLLQEQKRILGIDTPTKKKHQKHLQKAPKPGKNLNFPHPVKMEVGESSLSLVQSDPIGAFQVSDGGSTTITLVPLGEEEQKVKDEFASLKEVPKRIKREYKKSKRENLKPKKEFKRDDESPVPVLLSDSPSPLSLHDLSMPKVNAKKEFCPTYFPENTKQPEITITPIPRSIGNLHNFTSLQLADLMTLNSTLNSTLGVSALQDLAKIAERFDRSYEPSQKKMKTEDSNPRMNGASGRLDTKFHKQFQSDVCSSSHLPVPDLVSADLLRHMSALDNNSKLLLPAHQSTKTMNALAALLPQTSIFPAPAPAAHQHAQNRLHKVESNRPEPIFQPQSQYSQSKNIYGKPMPEINKNHNRDKSKSSSPDIEILDLTIPSENKTPQKQNRDRLQIELLDLSTRRDITVSAVPKPGGSRVQQGRIPAPHVSIKSSDNGKSGANSQDRNQKAAANSQNNPLTQAAAANALAAAIASAQGMNPALANLGMGNPSLLQYLMQGGMKGSSIPTSTPSQNPLSMFPFLDPSALSSYYSMLPPSLLGVPSSSASGSSHHQNMAAHQAQAAAAAAAQQFAQLNSLGLTSLANMQSESAPNLGIYKNYMPSGSLPPPHFLSGLMSPGSTSSNPPSSK